MVAFASKPERERKRFSSQPRHSNVPIRLNCEGGAGHHQSITTLLIHASVDTDGSEPWREAMAVVGRILPGGSFRSTALSRVCDPGPGLAHRPPPRDIPPPRGESTFPPSASSYVSVFRNDTLACFFVCLLVIAKQHVPGKAGPRMAPLTTYNGIGEVSSGVCRGTFLQAKSTPTFGHDLRGFSQPRDPSLFSEL